MGQAETRQVPCRPIDRYGQIRPLDCRDVYNHQIRGLTFCLQALYKDKLISKWASQYETSGISFPLSLRNDSGR